MSKRRTKSWVGTALKYHPDKNSGDADKFKVLLEAQETLTDPVKRAGYNAKLDETKRPNPTSYSPGSNSRYTSNGNNHGNGSNANQFPGYSTYADPYSFSFGSASSRGRNFNSRQQRPNFFSSFYNRSNTNPYSSYYYNQDSFPENNFYSANYEFFTHPGSSYGSTNYTGSAFNYQQQQHEQPFYPYQRQPNQHREQTQQKQKQKQSSTSKSQPQQHQARTSNERDRSSTSENGNAKSQNHDNPTYYSQTWGRQEVKEKTRTFKRTDGGAGSSSYSYVAGDDNNSSNDTEDASKKASKGEKVSKDDDSSKTNTDHLDRSEPINFKVPKQSTNAKSTEKKPKREHNNLFVDSEEESDYDGDDNEVYGDAAETFENEFEQEFNNIYPEGTGSSGSNFSKRTKFNGSMFTGRHFARHTRHSDLPHMTSTRFDEVPKGVPIIDLTEDDIIDLSGNDESGSETANEDANRGQEKESGDATSYSKGTEDVGDPVGYMEDDADDETSNLGDSEVRAQESVSHASKKRNPADVSFDGAAPQSPLKRARTVHIEEVPEEDGSGRYDSLKRDFINVTPFTQTNGNFDLGDLSRNIPDSDGNRPNVSAKRNESDNLTTSRMDDSDRVSSFIRPNGNFFTKLETAFTPVNTTIPKVFTASANSSGLPNNTFGSEANNQGQASSNMQNGGVGGAQQLMTSSPNDLLHLQPPKPPQVPSEVPTLIELQEYGIHMEKYFASWFEYSGKFTDYQNSRRRADESNGISLLQTSESVEKYLQALRQDQAVKAIWTMAIESHAVAITDYLRVRQLFEINEHYNKA
ncbi:type II HSP40 co-chaperone SIS1 [Sugiyamaella lignohabitans]|uniref:Type II HSP40 co-chaperone SIS1 n=1 Tax=Sugiyamaella lignohabitans TaxID=796027 RepID=A0A167EMC1_9ASCO|nr:type II HSP40 co-chaperone SIS1 [Sugiyamaella lignohabitans]ANB14248.1 type II HSP40 co-chaperone SIS1 [Sugiyamaella lignohabitans]